MNEMSILDENSSLWSMKQVLFSNFKFPSKSMFKSPWINDLKYTMKHESMDYECTVNLNQWTMNELWTWINGLWMHYELEMKHETWITMIWRSKISLILINQNLMTLNEFITLWWFRLWSHASVSSDNSDSDCMKNLWSIHCAKVDLSCHNPRYMDIVNYGFILQGSRNGDVTSLVYSTFW